MAKAPMMPIWTDALIADTTHLTPEQFGCYVLILLATWRNNGIAIEENDQKIARICRISVTKWRRKIRPFLSSFFSINDTGWHQQRLEKEWNRLESLKDESDQNTPQKKRATRARPDPRARPLTHTYKNPSSSSESDAARAFATREGYRTRDNEPSSPASEADTWKPLGLALGHPAPPPPEPSAENRRAERQQQHIAHLATHSTADELSLYLEAAMSDDPAAAERMFDLAEAQMQAWQHQHGNGVAA